MLDLTPILRLRMVPFTLYRVNGNKCDLLHKKSLAMRAVSNERAS